jgi:hypothetical protein
MARGALEVGFNQIKLAHKPKHNLKLCPKRILKYQAKPMQQGARTWPQNATIRS